MTSNEEHSEWMCNALRSDARGCLCWDHPLSAREKRERVILICGKEAGLAARHADRYQHQREQLENEVVVLRADAAKHKNESWALRLEMSMLHEENKVLQERARELQVQLFAAKVEVGPAHQRSPHRKPCEARTRLQWLRRQAREARELAAHTHKSQRKCARLRRECAQLRTAQACMQMEQNLLRSQVSQREGRDDDSQPRLKQSKAQNANAPCTCSCNTDGVATLQETELELLNDLRRQLGEKDATIANLRLQNELLGVRKGFEREMHGAEDLESRCQALKDSVAQFMLEADDPPHAEAAAKSSITDATQIPV